MKGTLFLHPAYEVGKVDPRIFGSFIEHLGRAVYHGIYEPSHPTADEEGFRRDVLEMVKKLGVPIVRYPGGNFVSGYCWEDGTGDKSKRPRKRDLSWKVIETNEVGIDEFQSWCKKANSEVMMAVNLGTRGMDDARNLLEYCNMEGESYYADMRRANGFEKPFGIKLWCLGNEMDGDWQIGTKTAEEYGKIARETAKFMKWMDPSIELVVSGTSRMKEHGDWDAEVLRKTYEYVDYISLHYYYPPVPASPAPLESSLIMDKHIESVCAIADYIKQVKHSDKTMYLCFDEWNVWNGTGPKPAEKWVVAPPSHEEVYSMQDALVVGTLLMSLLKHCDRVKVACLAQLVNAIAPIRTENAEDGGRCWAQTIFYPFMHCSMYGRGTVLDGRTDCPSYSTKGQEKVPYLEQFDNIPYLESCAVLSEDGSEITIFAVNRSTEESMEFDCDLSAFGATEVIEQICMNHEDLLAANTAEDPLNVVPVNGGDAVVEEGIVKATFEKHSWNVIRVKV